MSKKTNKQKRPKGIRIANAFLVSSLFVFLLIGVIIVVFYFKLPPLKADKMVMQNDSYVYDKNNKLIGRISRKQENQENIKYSQLNQSLINSLVGTEDANFFSHKGIDIISTLEKTFNQIVKSGDSSGGSSITQQIIGWSHLDRNEKTYSRKLQEILLALKAEKQVSKTDIITLYLNYFFYGKNNIHGIQRASEYFFNKNAYDLDYIQAALMTGTINAPTNYNPLGRYDTTNKKYINYSKQRLDTVLLSNFNHGYLNGPEYYLLQQVKVENTVNLNNSSAFSAKYSAYIDLVKREMQDKYKIDFTKNSLHIYTTMDPKAQTIADKITADKQPGAHMPDKDMDMAFLVSNTQTGAIAAVGGGKQYKNGGIDLMNNAIDIKKQPGSAFKPIIDYSPAYEYLHWEERHVLSNAPYKYPGTNTSIRNADGQSGGYLSIDAALASSRNLTAVRALEAVVNKIGFKELNKYLTNLGFEFSDDELTYAYALGGTNTGVSPLQMNGAYATFGNGGKYIKPWTVRYFINDANGEKTENTTKPIQAIDERTAFMMSSALERGTKKSTILPYVGVYGIPGNYVAKTGTTNWGHEGAQYGIPNLSIKDSWIAGFNDQYTISAWTGFDINGIKKGKSPSMGAEHDYAASIFTVLMRKLSSDNQKSYTKATPPKGIVKGYNGWVYSDNPNRTFKPQINEKDFKISASYDTINKTINFSFNNVTTPDGKKPQYYVQIGNNYGTSAGNYKINNNESFIAYYTYNDQKYGTVTGCVKNNKITYSGCPALR